MFEILTNPATYLMAFIVIAAVAVFALAVLLRRVVPTNMVHIVQSRNKTTEYGRNRADGNAYYHIPSWVPVFGVTVTSFPESNFQVVLERYQAYDSNRLPFMVDIAAFFRIDKASEAAQRVASFGELTDQLQDVLRGAVRSILASERLEVILESRADLANEFTKAVDEQLKEWGVKAVKSIEFMDITDIQKGGVIQQIMDKEISRIDRESRTAVAENNRQAQEAEIAATRQVDLTKQTAQKDVGINKAQADQEVGLAREKAKQEVAQANAVTTERDMEVKRVGDTRTAEIQRDVAIVAAEEAQRVAMIQADTQKAVQITKAEGERQATQTQAEGNLFQDLKVAEGTRAMGEAKAHAERALLQAPVDAQISLAKEIGENQGYQAYLVQIETIKASAEVGVAQAVAMQKAEIRIFANGGSISDGVSSAGNLFSAQGGTQLGAMAQAMGASPEGQQLLNALASSAQKGVSAAVSGKVATKMVKDKSIGQGVATGAAIG